MAANARCQDMMAECVTEGNADGICQQDTNARIANWLLLVSALRVLTKLIS